MSMILYDKFMSYLLVIGCIEMLGCVYRSNFNKLMCDIPTYQRGSLHFTYLCLWFSAIVMGAVMLY
jgi:hypothetical protein